MISLTFFLMVFVYILQEEPTRSLSLQTEKTKSYKIIVKIHFQNAHSSYNITAQGSLPHAIVDEILPIGLTSSLILLIKWFPVHKESWEHHLHIYCYDVINNSVPIDNRFITSVNYLSCSLTEERKKYLNCWSFIKIFKILFLLDLVLYINL